MFKQPKSCNADLSVAQILCESHGLSCNRYDGMSITTMKNMQTMRKSRSHWKHVVLEAKEYTHTARAFARLMLAKLLCSTAPSVEASIYNNEVTFMTADPTKNNMYKKLIRICILQMTTHLNDRMVYLDKTTIAT
jgi:hypothetical protein